MRTAPVQGERSDRGDHMLSRARASAPLIAAAADQIEAACELPAHVLDVLHDAGLFRMLLPHVVNGEEIEPLAFAQAMEVIAQADGSTAWCVGQASGCAMAAAYLSIEAAQEIWGSNPRAVLTWGAGPQGIARVVKGGYRVSGTWDFASCSRHATWLGGHSRLAGNDGQPSLRDGKAIERTMLFPRHHAAIITNWNVIGLRGTGSDSYRVDELFVPEEFAFSRDNPSERRQQGPLYYLTTTNIYAVAFAAVAIGIARGTLEAFLELASHKAPMATNRLLRDSPVVQAAVGLAHAKLRAARSFLFEALTAMWSSAQRRESPTIEQRMLIRMASTLAIQQAKEVVDMAYQASGATAIFQSNPFERRFRDIHTVTQQVQGDPAHFESIGGHLLGLPVNLRFI